MDYFNENEIRTALQEILINNPTSIRALALSIGLDEQVLYRFLKHGRSIHLKTMFKIVAFIRKQEKSLKD